MGYHTASIKNFPWLDVTKRKIGVTIIFFSVIFASFGYSLVQTPRLSNDASNKAAYQKYLKDQDKKSNEINYLLDLIENSLFSFERNGQKASGKDAVLLLKYKFKQYKNKISTTEDFIEKVASFSSHTKKNYFVILSSGEKLLLKDFLYAELNKLRTLPHKKTPTGTRYLG
ncbi:MAG: DUF5329 family protein [Candidatus Omnitrophica bacterium]|nr:DUF5329 family protein [Candidatus Omnitrophota bacterium]